MLTNDRNVRLMSDKADKRCKDGYDHFGCEKNQGI